MYFLTIDRETLDRNSREGRYEPPLRVYDCPGSMIRAVGVVLHGPSRLVYSPKDPLPEGEVVWIETPGPLQVNLGITTIDLEGSGEYLTTSEAAELLGVNPATLRKPYLRKKLRYALRTPLGTLYPREEVEQLAKERTR